MKPVRVVRPVLATIPDCLYELPPEEARRGQDLAISTLWNDASQALELDGAPKLSHDDQDDSDFQNDPTPLEELFEFGADIDEDQLVEALGDTGVEMVRRSVLVENGTDALAWYVTFHARGAQWGIYIPTSSLFYLASGPFGGLSADLHTRIRIAFRALHQHELFHFAVDYMASQWEAITGRACHKPARALRDPVLRYIVLEEQLANAWMIRSFWGGRSSLRARGRSDALRAFVRQQPVGYRDAETVVPAPAFRDGCERLARAYVKHIRDYTGSHLDGMDLMMTFPVALTIDWRRCPIHILHDGQRVGLPTLDLGLFRSVAGIMESETFRKQLAQMPRPIQAAWEQAKAQLEVAPQARGLDFKLWERRSADRIYSVRLNRSYRAHLSYQTTTQRWTALSVGSHHATGHG